MLKPHIVILGAGFGGTYLTKKLAPLVRAGKIEVTLVNRTNYFLFTPLLHEVATGSLTPTSVAEPLREIFHKTDIHISQSSVEGIDIEKRTVRLSGAHHTHEQTVPYDYLVIATGAETNYYGIPGAEKHSYPLKNLLDAARIRSRIIDVFEQAIATADPTERARLLSFIVVGGGATGVEMAAELAEFVHTIVSRYYHVKKDCNINFQGGCRPEEPTIRLINTSGELLTMFPVSLRKIALERLKKNGVIVSLNTSVTEATKDGLKLSTGETAFSSTVIWTAGVKPIVPPFVGITPQIVAGRIAVDEFFRVGGHKHVFALGDVAGYTDRDILSTDPTKTKLLPQLAQVASAQASTVAKNIIATIRGEKLTDFHYHSKGSMVSLGQWFALGEIYSLNIAGRITWWLWRTVYLFKFASWKKRIRIGFEWAFELVYPRDITKLT
jgi:NADH dehydrogenase